MTKICFSGIVKNEGRIIKRCLDSARFAIDYVCITDTGSTDDTVAIIEQWGKDNNIPTTVCHDVWKNFGHNRTNSVANSIMTYPEADYLLLLDADMQLENHGFDKTTLTDDYYLIDQYNESIEYGNVRLVSTKRKWLYVGVTHEYITPTVEGCKQGTCKTLKIYDIGDGGCKSDKFIRDEKLLSEALKGMDKKHPLYDRYNFYLAQTYFDTRKFGKAIRYYKRRLESDAFLSERWYSQFRIGVALEALGRWEEAEPTLLDAYQMMPSRCEPLVAIVNHYIINNKPQHHKAALFIPRLQEMRTEPNTDSLFNFVHYKQYYIDYLTSINSYYVGKLQLGREASYRVLTSKHAPQYIKESVKANLKFYE